MFPNPRQDLGQEPLKAEDVRKMAEGADVQYFRRRGKSVHRGETFCVHAIRNRKGPAGITAHLDGLPAVLIANGPDRIETPKLLCFECPPAFILPARVIAAVTLCK